MQARGSPLAQQAAVSKTIVSSYDPKLYSSAVHLKSSIFNGGPLRVQGLEQLVQFSIPSNPAYVYFKLLCVEHSEGV